MSDGLTFGARLSALSNDLGLLVSGTAAIARAEASASTKEGVAAGGLIAAGAFLGCLASLTLVAGVVLAIVALGLPAWAAALGVGLLLAIGGWLLARSGVEKLRHVSFTFPETRGSIEESLQWLKELGR
jgi:hypothetical protein